MNIFQRIKALVTKQDTGAEEIMDIETMIRELDEASTTSKAAIQKIEARRNELLLADDDAALDRDAVEIEKHRRTIEKANLLRPGLVAKLLKAKDAYRKRVAAQLRKEGQAHALAMIAALKAVSEANKNAAEWHDRVRAQLGDAAANYEFPTIAVPLFQGDFVTPLQSYLDQSGLFEKVAPLPKPAPPPAPVVRLPVAEQPKPVTTAPLKTNRQPLPERPPEGKTRVFVVRGCVSLEDGTNLRNGDLIDFPADRAIAAVRSGAFEFAPLAPQAAEAIADTGAPAETSAPGADLPPEEVDDGSENQAELKLVAGKGGRRNRALAVVTNGAEKLGER